MVDYKRSVHARSAQQSLIGIMEGIENGNLSMTENLVLTSASARKDSGSRGKKLSRVGK